MSETGGSGSNTSPHSGRLHWASNGSTPSDGTGAPGGAGLPQRPPTQPVASQGTPGATPDPARGGAHVRPSFGPPTGAPTPSAATPAGATAGAQQPTAPLGAPAASAATTTADGTPPAGPEGGSGRPRWLVPAIIGAVVVVVAGIVIGILVTRGGDEPTPGAAASTVLLPSPTPTIEPVARTATTSFAAALPVSVLQYALASSATDEEWLAAGAVEAYTEAYSDGAGGEVTVRAGQWETPEEAVAYAATLVAALPAAPAADAGATATATAGTSDLPQTGEVLVGGAPAGTFTIVDAGDGTGVAVWTNGSSVFRVVAPVEDVADVYAAFPL